MNTSESNQNFPTLCTRDTQNEPQQFFHRCNDEIKCLRTGEIADTRVSDVCRLVSILTVVSLSLDANLLRDVPNQPDPAIQPNQACCVKPSLNGNSNSTASNCLNPRRIREQRLFSAAVAARILKLSASPKQGLAKGIHA